MCPGGLGQAGTGGQAGADACVGQIAFLGRWRGAGKRAVGHHTASVGRGECRAGRRVCRRTGGRAGERAGLNVYSSCMRRVRNENGWRQAGVGVWLRDRRALSRQRGPRGE